MGFLENLVNGSPVEKGLVITLGGMAGVFVVLLLFFIIIKVFAKLFPYKG